MNNSPEILTPREAAELLKFSVAKLYQLVQRRRIPFFRPPGTRAIRFEKSQLLKWLGTRE